MFFLLYLHNGGIIIKTNLGETTMQKSENEKTTLNLKLDNRSYPIHIEPGSINSESLRQLVQQSDAGNCVIITDHHLYDIYSDWLKMLKVIVVKAGESSKDMCVYESVLEQMIKLGISRTGTIIAFGGGVIGDLAGFVAATYMRGIDFYQIPTSLLAMVDSSIGGKVAVNLSSGKNLVGTFYQPKAVYIDPLLLKTLDKREWANGMAEVLKYAIGFEYEFFDELSKYTLTDIMADEQLLIPIIARCCKIKIDVVEQDEKDMGIRNLLNFGHTIGHAIEAHYNYEKYLHGEGIAIGMAIKAKLAVDSGLLNEAEMERILEVISKYDLPIKLSDMMTKEEVDQLLSYIIHDKKRQVEEVEWITFKKLGQLESKPEKIETFIEHISKELLKA